MLMCKCMEQDCPNPHVVGERGPELITPEGIATLRAKLTGQEIPAQARTQINAYHNKRVIE